jgi:flagella basal body P-ring formation protein FlgA
MNQAGRNRKSQSQAVFPAFLLAGLLILSQGAQAVIILPENVDWSRNGYREPISLQEGQPEPRVEPSPEPTPVEPLVHITLEPPRDLPDRMLTLGDVALVRCKDLSLLERVRSVELFHKPKPGNQEVLVPRRVEASLRALGLGHGEFLIDGLDRLVIEAPSQEVPMEEIERAVNEALYARSLLSQPGEVEAFMTRAPSLPPLPPGKLDIEVLDLDRPGSGIRNIMLAFYVDGEKVDTKTVPVQVHQKVYGLVAARPLARGEIIREADLKEGLVPFSALGNEGPVVEANLLVGATVQRPIAMEQGIRQDDIEFEPIIPQGTPVTLLQSIGSIKLTAPGVVAEDIFELGQEVRVRKVNSRQEIHGKAIDWQTVLVE